MNNDLPLAAIVLTFILVISGFDWFYFRCTRSPSLRAWMFPAAPIGDLVPITLPLILVACGIVIGNGFLKCVRSRKDPYFPVDIGHRVSTVCHLGNIAIKRGQKLKWDPKREHFVADAEANKMLDRPHREPWQLPMV